MDEGLTALQVLDVMSRTLEFAKKEIRSATKPSGKRKAAEPAAEAVAAASNGRKELAGRLAEWFTREDLDDTKAAKIIGCHPTSVRTWRLGLGDPRPESMKAIDRVLSKAGV
jgi:hypothetical protein